MHARLIVFALVLVALPAHAGPQIRNWEARSGAQVFFVESRELPMVDIEVTFDGGSARDPAGLEGLALVTNILLDEGADGLHANDVAYEFERLGAQYGAEVNEDSTSISLRSLSDKKLLRAALTNFRRVLLAPDFPQDAIDRQRNRLLIGIRQKKQDPGAVANDAFQAAVFGDHPYARPSEGTEESVGRIARADIVRFHADYYVARNATIAIVGDLSSREARRLADQLTSGLRSGAAPPPIPMVSALASATALHIAHPSAQTHVLVGQPGMKYNDPDYFPLYVGNFVLGGGGLVSRLFNEIREQRGLSYSAYSYFAPMRQPGPFLAGLQTQSEQAGEALQVLHQTLQGFIKDGPTAEELQAARQNITGGFPLRIDSNSKILAYVAAIGFYGLPLDYLDTFNDKVEAVTAENVRDAFKRRIDPDHMVTITVGPGGDGPGAVEPAAAAAEG